MDDLFAQIDYRSKSDVVVMRLLRLAMDKAHENVQSMNGPMEFLHERSKFYELAAILVEGGLNIVQEGAADIQETSREKILTDLIEIKDWLRMRNEEMRHLIIEKDKELLGRIESELKLRETLALNETELEHLKEKEELERTKSEGYHEFHQSSQGILHDEAIGGGGGGIGDIRALKNSVDQQVWNIKQKLEDEKRNVKNKMTKLVSNVSDTELYAKLGSEFMEDDHHLSGVQPFFCRTLNHGKYNRMIRQMSSDIDILKGTFDMAFGRMQNVEVLPLEKRWKMIIERYTILVSVKGFIRDVQKFFDAEFNNRNHCIPSGCCFCREKWTGLIRDVTALADELKGLCSKDDHGNDSSSGNSLQVRRTVSEPIPELLLLQTLEEESTKSTGIQSVAKMIKNHETFIEKHREASSRFVTKEIPHRKMPMSIKRDKEPDELENRIKKVIRKLDKIIESNKKNLKVELCDHRSKNPVRSDSVSHSDVGIYPYKKAEELTSSKILLQWLDYSIRNDVYAVYMQELASEWKRYTECRAEECILQEEVYKFVLIESVKCIQNSGNLLMNQVENECSASFSDAVESRIREDVHMVYFSEMSKGWESERDDHDIEVSIRMDVYRCLMDEMVKQSNAIVTTEPETLNQKNVPKEFHFVTDSDIHRDESSIGDLDSILDCADEQRVPSDVISLSSSSKDVEEQNIKKWLLTAGEKLETVLHEVHTSKALLSMLDKENSMSNAQNYQEQDDNSTQLNDIVAVEPERKSTYFLEEEDEMLRFNQSILSPLIRFQQLLVDFEHTIHRNLESKSLRMEALKQQVSELAQPVTSIRKRKFLYKKAFITRCQNLLLAENEVDLLGNQVDKLVCLLQRVYLILNQNSGVLSPYFQVFDMLNLIKTELAKEAA